MGGIPPLTLLLLFVFLDVFGFSLLLPLIPFYAEKFGASPFRTGLVAASNACAQLIASPCLGKLSDHYGRKPILLICIFGTFVSFLLLGFATSFEQLLFSRILDGLLGGDVALAQAYISDVTSPQERSKKVGLIGAAFGVSFIFGPAIGAALATRGFRVPPFVGAGLSFVNLLAIWQFLPESLPKHRRDRKPLLSYLPIAPLMYSLRQAAARPLIVLRFFYSFVFTMFESSFSTCNRINYGLDFRQSGLLLTFVAVFFSGVQGGGIARLTKRTSERRLITVSFLLLSLSQLASSLLTPNIPLLLVVLLPFSICCGILNTLVSSQLSRAVVQEEVGGAMGLSAALAALTRVIGPPLSGFLIERYGTASIGICGFIVSLSMYLYSSKSLDVLPETKNAT